MGNSTDGVLEHLLPGLVQFMGQVNIGGGNERVNAGAFRTTDRLPRPVDVSLNRPAESRYRALFDYPRNSANRLKVSRRGNRKAGLNDIHPQSLKLLRHPDLFVPVHAAPRRLLAITQRGVKD